MLTSAIISDFRTAEGAFTVELPNHNGNAQTTVIHDPSDGDAKPSKGDAKHQVLSLAREQGKITRKEVEEAFDCGSTKAYKLLKALCEEGLLIQQKNGNQTVYLPAK